MKKYLMIGFAAIAFASCSNHDIETMSQTQIDKAKYDQKFIETFGKPDPNHTWGFGATTRALTRAEINVNGNLWESCPEVGSTEDADVAAYVRALTTLPNTNPAQLQNYYVTQIHKGTETYTDLDGHSGILGSDKMNNLHIAMQSTATLNTSTGGLEGDWEHINNFNAGNCTDWSAGVDGHGNTLVTGGGTFDFAYECAEDSKYHNRWIAIDGANVPKTGGGNYAGNYYVCFDFEATNDNVKTVFEVRQPGNNPGEVFTDNVTVDGAWTVESAAAAGLTVTARGNQVTITTENAEVKQYQEGNKVVIGNDVYDDWIIRLVEAEPKDNTDPIEYKWRIMAEDLSVQSNSDFDFNDVVFDAKIDATANKTYIKLLAAGGTLELYIGDESHEVHGLFKVSTKTMVNTINPNYDTAGVEFELPYYSSYENIPIYVKKSGEWEPITAQKGTPAAKFACPVGTEWQVEYTNINEKYSGFNAWVADESASPWEADF